MFSKCEQRCFIKIHIARGKNARQWHTALLEACGREILPYRTVARWAYIFRRGGKCHRAVIAVKQSVHRLIQQDTMHGISILPDVWRQVRHVEGDYF